MAEHEQLDVVLAENKYGKYCIPRKSLDRPCSRAVMNGGVYEPDTIQFMLDNHNDRDVITGGLFFGDFLPALMSSCSGQVIGFEPEPQNFRCAAITAALNSFHGHNTSLYNLALGAEASKKPLENHTATGNFVGGGTKVIDQPTVHTTDYCKVERGDDVVSNSSNVGIIQLDVEGYEEQALKGLTKIISSNDPILILEVWNAKMFETEFFDKEIFSKGYKIRQELHANVVLSK